MGTATTDKINKCGETNIHLKMKQKTWKNSNYEYVSAEDTVSKLQPWVPVLPYSSDLREATNVLYKDTRIISNLFQSVFLFAQSCVSMFKIK